MLLRKADHADNSFRPETSDFVGPNQRRAMIAAIVYLGMGVVLGIGLLALRALFIPKEQRDNIFRELEATKRGRQ